MFGKTVYLAFGEGGTRHSPGTGTGCQIGMYRIHPDLMMQLHTDALQING
jgi:hypothetical protein